MFPTHCLENKLPDRKSKSNCKYKLEKRTMKYMNVNNFVNNFGRPCGCLDVKIYDQHQMSSEGACPSLQCARQ